MPSFIFLHIIVKIVEAQVTKHMLGHVMTVNHLIDGEGRVREVKCQVALYLDCTL